MRTILHEIYGVEKGDVAYSCIAAILNDFNSLPETEEPSMLSEAEIILICYGDTLKQENRSPLESLHHFANEHLANIFSGIHILPFFPYSSDDGFSITEFHAVRSDLGGWEDVQAIGSDFKLMVDLVANHISAKSTWFQDYLAQQPGFQDLAIEMDPSVDLTAVTRPRASALLTPFSKASGRRVYVWTTFSSDQVDLNYQSIDVLVRMVQTLLYYVNKGARIIRLDAIAYLWKKPGTTCIHLDETHAVVRLFRRILDMKAPGVILVTETNVPHEENISYFGSGFDEAQMVYNFTLPPLLLYSLIKGSAKLFSEWARTLRVPSPQTAFFNFTASHDGIGVRPLEGILSADEINWLAEQIRRNGGMVSEKQNPDGSTSPYELNTTYFDALKNPAVQEDPHQMPRFLASQAVALTLPGVPGVYIHSLLGTTNWIEGVRITGRARTINRKKLSVEEVHDALANPNSLRAKIFKPYLKMLRIRKRQPAFRPAAAMQVLQVDDRVFAVKRLASNQMLLAMTNFSGAPITLSVRKWKCDSGMVELLQGIEMDTDTVTLHAYQTMWLTSTPFDG